MGLTFRTWISPRSGDRLPDLLPEHRVAPAAAGECWGRGSGEDGPAFDLGHRRVGGRTASGAACELAARSIPGGGDGPGCRPATNLGDRSCLIAFSLVTPLLRGHTCVRRSAPRFPRAIAGPRLSGICRVIDFALRRWMLKQLCWVRFRSCPGSG